MSGGVQQIAGVHAREILDSRGNPTVEVEVRTSSGAIGRAAVPSGASTGAREALELRDGDRERYGGKGVLRAVAQRERRDRAARPSGRPLGGARRAGRARRGADRARRHRRPSRGSAPTRSSASRWPRRTRRRPPPACRSTASSAARARRCCPAPMMNVLNGGAHADNKRRPPGVHALPARRADLLRGAALGRRDVPHAEAACCTTKGYSTAVGDEGGFAPNLDEQPRGDRAAPRGDREGRLPAGRADRDRARPGGERVPRGRALRARGRGRTPRARTR